METVIKVKTTLPLGFFRPSLGLCLPWNSLKIPLTSLYSGLNDNPQACLRWH